MRLITHRVASSGIDLLISSSRQLAACYKQSVSARWLLFGMSVLAFAQESAPPTVVPQDGLRVMHCIKSGDRDWLAPPLSGERETLRFGFTRDGVSYPGESHLIVVVYEARSKGQVFDLLDQSSKRQMRLKIVNNGRFTAL